MLQAQEPYFATTVHVLCLDNCLRTFNWLCFMVPHVIDRVGRTCVKIYHKSLSEQWVQTTDKLILAKKGSGCTRSEYHHKVSTLVIRTSRLFCQMLQLPENKQMQIND